MEGTYVQVSEFRDHPTNEGVFPKWKRSVIPKLLLAGGGEVVCSPATSRCAHRRPSGRRWCILCSPRADPCLARRQAGPWFRY